MRALLARSWPGPAPGAVLLICVLVEGVLILADHGLVGSALWRARA